MSSKHKSTILLVILVFFLACLPFPGLPQITCQNVRHNLMSNVYEKTLWSIQDIYSFNTGNGPLLASTSGRLFVVANTPSYSGHNLLSYDTLTGNLLWHRPVDLPVLLFVTDGKLYLGQNDEIGVFDSVTGNLLEEISLPKAGTILSLYQIGDKFFIYSSSGRFIVFDISAKQIVTTTEPNLVESNFLIDNDITYSHKGYEFIAFNKSTGTVVWQVEINEPFTNPIFQNDMIFIRTGSPIYAGSIYAINRSTGAIAWKKDLNIISNVVAQDSALYFLTVDGFLVVLDQRTGQEIDRMQFTSAPFLLPDTQNTIGGYYVSADIDNKVILVSLGDSCQLIAVKLQDQ